MYSMLTFTETLIELLYKAVSESREILPNVAKAANEGRTAARYVQIQ